MFSLYRKGIGLIPHLHGQQKDCVIIHCKQDILKIIRNKKSNFFYMMLINFKKYTINFKLQSNGMHLPDEEYGAKDLSEKHDILWLLYFISEENLQPLERGRASIEWCIGKDWPSILLPCGEKLI